VVSGGRVFTQVRRLSELKQREFCLALDSQTGQELWATSLDAAQYPDDGALWGTDGSVLGGLDEPRTFQESDEGPRSTPAVDGDRVYVMTSFLRLVCLDGMGRWDFQTLRFELFRIPAAG
jgi:outer membrane protein assembly factor BamB